MQVQELFSFLKHKPLGPAVPVSSNATEIISPGHQALTESHFTERKTEAEAIVISKTMKHSLISCLE